MKHLPILLACILATAGARADWALKDDANTELPGRKVDITQDGVLRARLIYGEGQIKPYLRVQGEEGDGLNEWDPKQQFPHHRGIYIGWNKIASDLGSNVGPLALDQRRHDDADEARQTQCRKGLRDHRGDDRMARRGEGRGAGSDLLLTETRTLTVSRPRRRPRRWMRSSS